MEARSLQHDRILVVRILVVLGAAVALATASCTSPPALSRRDLPERSTAIVDVELLPPLVTLYEEQLEFEYVATIRKVSANGPWTGAAAEALRVAFREELGSVGQRLREGAVDPADRDDVADLYGAVDFSMRRHAFDEMDEAFPERSRELDYSLGPIAARPGEQLDACWVVAGAELLPTIGVKVADTVDFVLEVVAAVGGKPVISSRLEPLDLRAALVDRDGTVLFACIVRSDHVSPPAGSEDVGSGAPGDLRDPAYARQVVRAILDAYRRAARR